jgi:hypothetical protein
MRRILFSETDFASLPNPPAGFKYIGFDGPNFSEKDENGSTTPTGGGSGSATSSFISLTNNAAPINIWLGPEVSFTKADYATGSSATDEIDTDLSITRGVEQGIYNSALEQEWDDSYGDPNGRKSPQGTLWNSSGWGNLTNLDQRTYQSFYDSVGGNLGNLVLSKNFIMKDVANDTYYKIDFTIWGNAGAGAPFTYTRQQVDPVDGSDIGSLVTFVKPGYADPFITYDDISTEVRISRANYQGIFNTVIEQGYNGNQPGDGDGENSPQGTEWNLDGWLDLTDIKQRTYKPFVEIFDGNLGERLVNTECVMHDTINDKYYTIKFTQWSGGGNGGGFAYKRRLINADVVFVHTENGNEVDDIANSVGITRDSNESIYNPYEENGWDENVSPYGTSWNFDGIHDLSDVESRVYRTFWESVQFYGIGQKIEGKEAVMKVGGDYYTIKFTHWQQGGGGAFSYIRTLIDLSKLNEGIRFADGTVQKTASDNRVKFKGPLGRRIEEYYGYEEVDITEAQSYKIETTIHNNQTNSVYFNIYVIDEQFAIDINNEVLRNLSVSFDNGVSWIAVESNGYGSWPSWYVNLRTTDDRLINCVSGQPVKLKYWRGGEPQLWFNPEKSPGGDGNFRGAIIDYHGYSRNSGTIVGQIITSRDNGDYYVTHTESSSGDSNLSQLVLWYSQESPNDYISGEGKLYAYRVDGDGDEVKIQWKATMFYGSEFWD